MSNKTILLYNAVNDNSQQSVLASHLISILKDKTIFENSAVSYYETVVKAMGEFHQRDVIESIIDFADHCLIPSIKTECFNSLNKILSKIGYDNGHKGVLRKKIICFLKKQFFNSHNTEDSLNALLKAIKENMNKTDFLVFLSDFLENKADKTINNAHKDFFRIKESISFLCSMQEDLYSKETSFNLIALLLKDEGVSIDVKICIISQCSVSKRLDLLRILIPMVGATDQPFNLKYSIISALGFMGDNLATGCLMPFIKHENSLIRAQTASSLGILRSKVADGLIFLLDDKNPLVRNEAIIALGRLKTKLAFNKLLFLSVNDTELINRENAVKALVEITSNETT